MAERVPGDSSPGTAPSSSAPLRPPRLRDGGGDLLGCWVAVLGWAALHHIQHEYILSRTSNEPEEEIEKLRRLVRLLEQEDASAYRAEVDAMRSELAVARNALAERKLIDQAKGILMKRQGVDEATAYRAMQKMAM